MSTVHQLLENQRAFFKSQQTKELAFRILNLKKLRAAIIKNSSKITDALYVDLHKSYEEAYLSEISIVLGEIDYHLKNLKEWARPKQVHTPFHLLPSSSKIITEPLGQALIIAPWNYPFQLTINPLVGAISAGCTAILKPSTSTPTVSNLIAEIIAETFDADYIHVVLGGRAENILLLEQKFDVIFFTGSSSFGKAVMQAASKHLTPVILELGGKSPCIVDETANIKIAAKRIIWGKLINAGQTCIAPDYVYVHERVKDQLIKEMIHYSEEMYGKNFKESNYYPRIINNEAFDRLLKLLKDGSITWGGDHDKENKYIGPTILENVSLESATMKEEIFGPILPMFTFTNIEQAIDYINKQEKPLALYYFGGKKNLKMLVNSTSSGGVCVNDTLLHIANHHLPFGGVGNSGMGKYHGEESYYAFSNRRSILTSPTWIDLIFKYPPFKLFNLIKKIM
jgi:aldehyde dehydrogenase (NAD+)